MTKSIVDQDVHYIYEKFSERDSLENVSVLITGCAGFIGYLVLHFFAKFAQDLHIRSVIGLDNFMMGKPGWLDRITGPNITIRQFDIVKDDLCIIDGADKAQYVMHLASVASPIYYRQHPIETLDANVTGLRKLLDFYRDKSLKGFLFMSSSEIYGNPDSAWIPTPEYYHGDVASIGPRACYDESKRFGETLCYVFSKQYGMPLTIVRPFNNYGPGTRLNDRRVTADIVHSVMANEDIRLYSDGSPMRTFCYIADAVVGYFKAMVYGHFDCFNIGSDKPEITMRQLADLYVKIAGMNFGYTGKVTYATSEDVDYLVDNPQRRCPDLTKSKRLLGFEPAISLQEGIYRYLRFLKESPQSDYIW